MKASADVRAAEPAALSPLDLVLLLALGLAVRVPLILAYPAIHGDDSVHRIARSDILVLAYQLPLAQLLVFLGRAAHPDPRWTRLLFAIVGALVALALAAVMTATAGRSAGRAAGALLALHPLFVYYSLVPYQESLMLLLLLGGAVALLHRREGVASLCLGLACLCRYEAWIIAGLAFLAHRRRPLRAALLYGWAPALWIATWRGLSPPGTYVLDVDPATSRLLRLPFLVGKLREYSGDALLLLALAGCLVAWYRRPRSWEWGAGGVAVVLFVILAVGHEFPPGTGWVSERLAHVPAAALCALSGLAIGAGADILDRRRAPLGSLLAAALLAALGVGWARRSEALVVEANQDPSLRLAVEVAHVAGARLPAGGTLAVAAPPVGEQALLHYVRKVEQAGGDAVRARVIALDLARHSPDLERISAHVARPPGAVVAAGAAADLVAVFDDAPAAGAWRQGPVVARFVEGPRGVTVYRPAAAASR